MSSGKKIVVLVSLLTFVILTSKITFAAPSNNPVFATLAQVNQLISNALAPVLSSITNLINRTETLEQKVSDLEAEIELLKALPSPTPSPTPSPSISYIVSNNSWRFSAIEVTGWLGISFDDSSWVSAQAPSGGQCSPAAIGLLINENGALPMSVSSPNWASGTGYFRKTINLTGIPSAANLRVVLDDDGDFYLNGNLVLSDHDNGVAGIQQVNIPIEYFLNGINTLGLKVVDSAGGCQHAQVELSIQN